MWGADRIEKMMWVDRWAEVMGELWKETKWLRSNLLRGKRVVHARTQKEAQSYNLLTHLGILTFYKPTWFLHEGRRGHVPLTSFECLLCQSRHSDPEHLPWMFWSAFAPRAWFMCQDCSVYNLTMEERERWKARWTTCYRGKTCPGACFLGDLSSL
jgi:hypothetical protein